MPVRFDRLDNGDLRFTELGGAVYTVSFYDPGIVRVRYWPSGDPNLNMLRTWAIVGSDGDCPPEGHVRHRLDRLKRFTRSTCEITDVANQVKVTCGTLTLLITREPFAITWATDETLFADNPLIGYHIDRKSGALAHTLSRTLDEHYYGFGEKAGPLDKHSRRMRMRNADVYGYDAETSDPLYKHVPFYITLRDRHGTAQTEAYGLFYDTPYDCEFDMGAELDNYYGDYRVFRAAGGDLDYWLLYGPTIEQVVEKYTWLTGRPPLPPRWSLGYLGSAMRYTDAPNAQAMLTQFIDKCRLYDIPCSGFHLSSGYSMADDGKRYVFTWNRERVPDPKKMVNTFHKAKMSLAANIKPAMLTTHPRYDEAERLFIRAESSDTPDLAPFWGGSAAHLDFTNPATLIWWKQNVKLQLLNYGIDSTWNDNNEFNLRSDDARCNGFGTELPVAALRPIQTMLMVQASHQAQREFAPDKRAWVLTRAGFAGIQRYAATWTGDNRSSWKTLRYNIPMGLGLSLSGLANFGHDVGGFGGDPPDPELFVRWVQNGIFHPRFCIHSWRTDDAENAPWMHPSVLPQVRDAIRLRYQLIPYLYTLMRESAETGHPVIRPTVYHFPDDPICHTQSFEFMLGPSLLIASVLEPGTRHRTTYLPAGTGWCDWYTGNYYQGGQTITLNAPLERPPLLVREGSLIPTEVDGKRRVYAFPSRTTGESHFQLYEDDGETLAYQRGEYSLIDLHMASDFRSITLSASAEVEWVVPAPEKRTLSIT